MSKNMLLDINVPDLERVKKQLGSLEKQAPKAIRNAINKTLTETSKLMTKAVKENYTAKVTNVKKTLTISKAKGKDLSGKITSKSTKKIPLKGFSVGPAKPKPLNSSFTRAKVKKRNSRKSLAGSGDRSSAFVAEMRSGHVGVFQRVLGKEVSRKTQRTEKRDQSPWAGRIDQPIAELFGMPVPYMIGEAKTAKSIQKESSEFLKKKIKEEINKIKAKG